MYVFGVGRGMTFVLLNMPHNFVWGLHEEANYMCCRSEHMKKQTKTLRGGRKNKKIFCNILIF